MTLVEAIRETWGERRDPLPTTVAECKALRDSGYGSTVEDDRYGVSVMFTGSTVRARLTDRQALRDWDIEHGEVESVEWTFREFVDAMSNEQQELFA